METSWSRYVVALVLTVGVFATAAYISIQFNNRRVTEIRGIGENVAIDILSLETQFDLLSELPCDTIQEDSDLSRELGALTERLAYAENTLGSDNEVVQRLKRQYFLLEIKDMILMRKIAEKCELKPILALYFYGTDNSCPDCGRQGAILTALQQERPDVRVYSFDYASDVPAVRTLIALNKVPDQLPAVVIGHNQTNGLASIEDLTNLLPPAPKTATSTKATTTKAH